MKRLALKAAVFVAFLFVFLAAIRLLAPAERGNGRSDVKIEDPRTSDIPAPEPPRPAYNYVMHDGVEYGYERALSDQDRQAGRAAAPLFVVRYLGEHAGRYQVFHKASEALIEVYECGQPCEFATIYRFVDDEYVATERIRVAANTIADAMFNDVLAGRLQQHLYLRNGKRSQGWVDKTGNMVFFPAP